MIFSWTVGDDFGGDFETLLLTSATVCDGCLAVGSLGTWPPVFYLDPCCYFVAGASLAVAASMLMHVSVPPLSETLLEA